jgi:serine phosphatase RsbU (regulator of sigma subunit)
MFTDGITEAMYERDEFYGVERLQQELIENGRSSASEICESI